VPFFLFSRLYDTIVPMNSFLTFINHNAFDIPLYLSILLLGITLVIQVSDPKILEKHVKRIFLYSTGLIVAYFIYIGYLQYRAFQTDLMVSVLGTTSGLKWFFGYVQTHYWNDYLISFPVAVLFVLLGNFFNKKYHERFFEHNEIYLAALGILLVGYPGFLFYLFLVLFAPLIASLLFVKRGERLALYYFWIPIALILVFSIEFLLTNYEWWLAFRF